MGKTYFLAAAGDDIPPIQPPITGMVGKSAEAVFANFISGLVGVILLFATIWTLFQLLQAGLEWISSGGDKTGLENAHGRIINAFIGLFIEFSGWVIYLFILKFLGISTIEGPGIMLKLPTLI